VTVGATLAAGRERLRSAGDDGRFDALRLLEESLNCSAAWILAHRDDDLDAAAADRYAAAIERRARGEPVAYIGESAGFYGRTFAVDASVLVPRPETEHVLALALEGLRGARRAAPARICDVGTGSGILAITLALELPEALVTASDISSHALAVAERNASAHGVRHRIRFVCGDAFEAIAPDERFDCIVANLPYVKTADLRPKPDPTAFEPVLALDGGRDGLDVYRRFLPGAVERLAADGAAFLEAGPDTTEALAELTVAAFPTGVVRVHQDYGGRERVVELRRGSAPLTEKANDP
jgi:release factor glutamine methyltransferase